MSGTQVSGAQDGRDRAIHIEPVVPRARSGLRVQAAVVAVGVAVLGAVSAGLLAPLSAAAPASTGMCTIRDPLDRVGSTARCPPPVANDDAYTVAQGSTLTVPAPGVLTNDEAPTRPDGRPIELVAVLDTRHMYPVSINSNGELTYTPRPGFVGEDTVNYHVETRGYGRDQSSKGAVIRITVTEQAPPPAQVANRVRGGGVLTTDGGQKLSLSVDAQATTDGVASGKVGVSGPTPFTSRTVTGVRRQGATATVTGTATGAGGASGPFTLTVTDRGTRGDQVAVTFGRTTTTGTLTTGDITVT